MNKKPNRKTIMVVILVFLLSVSICAVYSYHQFVRMEEKSIERKTQNYKALKPIALRNATVFFGDSITELCPLEDIYGEYMETSHVPIVNRGISSEQTGMMLARIEDSVINLQPRNLIMLMGINDLFAGVKPEIIVQNMSDMIELVKDKSPHTNIILQSIYPINKEVRTSLVDRLHGFNTQNEDIIAMNKRLKILANQQGITYVNIFETLVDAKGNMKREYAYDGLHPNTQGYIATRDKIIALLI